ncbi:MAG: hypothetical protein LUG60_02070, partial [Erysipelotrichaceae bacterium]|nr:hypothetical protein [Erysipelotrichaceae bacterium]
METVCDNIDVITKSSLIFSSDGYKYDNYFSSDDDDYVVAVTNDGRNLKLVLDLAWTINDDYSEATVTYTLSGNDYVVTTTDITKNVVYEISCLRQGLTRYTAKITIYKDTYTYTENVYAEKLDHEYGDMEFDWNGTSCTAKIVCKNCGSYISSGCNVLEEFVEATCTEPAKIIYTATKTLEGVTGSDTKIVTYGEANGHTYGEPEWTWNEDYTSATATFSCENCDDQQTVTASNNDITSSKTTEATCEETGKTTYKAKVTFNGVEYTDEQIVATTSALGHNYTLSTITWEDDFSKAKATFICLNDSSHSLTKNMEVNTKTTATCTKDG